MHTERLSPTLPALPCTLAACLLTLATGTALADAATGRKAPNGVPVYDIAPANPQGLSHNVYSQLQVKEPGAVFNNSLQDGRSQLAGFILKNPRLSPGHQASAILLEVAAGGAASRLSGALEVFGPRAALIIANPNGILADGLMTLNASALSLMAGASRQTPHGLRLSTTDATVEIGPGGVNTDGLSRFDLIARVLQLQGPIGPGQSGRPARLRLQAGAAALDPATGQLQATAQTATGAHISGSALGAMYGSHITLVATGRGAGVNLPGALLSPDDIRIQADGDIAVAALQAGGQIRLAAGQNLQLGRPEKTAAALQGGTTLTLSAGKTLQVNGTSRALDDIDVQAARLDNHATLASARGALTLKLDGPLHNTGRLLAANELALNAQDLRNDGQMQAGGLLRGNSSSLHNTGRIQAADIAWQTGVLDNAGRLEAADRARWLSTSLRNQGSITAQDLTLQTEQMLLLDGHAPQGRQRLQLIAPAFTIRQRLSASEDLSLQATRGDIDNHNAIESAGTLRLNAAGNLRNHDTALIWGARDVGLHAGGGLENGRDAFIGAGRDLSAQADGRIINRAGRIESGADMRLDSPVLENLATLAGSLSIARGKGPQISSGHFAHYRDLRWVHLTTTAFKAGQVRNQLRAQQGVIHAGGNLDINQHERAGHDNALLNQARLTSAKHLRIHADVDNLSLSRTLSSADHLRATSPMQSRIWDILALANGEDRRYGSLYELLDYALASTDRWTTLFVAYNYNHNWLGETLATVDFSAAPDLERTMAQVLGGDWRGLSAAGLSQRWQAFKRGERGQHLQHYYPEQRTVLGGRQGVRIDGALRNGEHADTPGRDATDPALLAALDSVTAAVPSSPPTPRPPAATPSAPPAAGEARPNGAFEALVNGVPHVFATAAQRDAFLLTHKASQAEQARQRQRDAERQAQASQAEREAALQRSLRTDELLLALKDMLANAHRFHRQTGAQGPLYETRLAYTDPERFYGSAYFFQQIGYRPSTLPRPGGDAIFDTTLIERQAERLLGAQTLRQAAGNEARARELMDNAALVQAKLGLRPGRALTETQLRQLDRDIVWYVSVMHQGRQLLLPRLYLSTASRQQAQRLRDAGGAAIATAGRLDIDTGPQAGRDLRQRHALLLGGELRLKTRGLLQLDDDERGGGAQADHGLLAAGADIKLFGARLQAQDIRVHADRNLDITSGRDLLTASGARPQQGSGLFARGDLTLLAGADLRTRGAALSGDAVTLQAHRLLLGEVRAQSGRLQQQSRFGPLSYAVQTTRSTRDEGLGTEVLARTLQMRSTGDVALNGARLRAQHTEAIIGGNLITMASQTFQTSDSETHSLDFVASAKAGAGGHEASISFSTSSAPQSSAGVGSMAGAELKTGMEIGSSRQHDTSLTHRNSQLDLGQGRLYVQGDLDLGGADINAARAQATARHTQLLDIEAARIVTTNHVDRHESETSGWGLFAGNKSTARSSLLDVASNLAPLAQQAEAGREIDPLLTSLQVAGDVSNLLLNDTGELATGQGLEFNHHQSSQRRLVANTHTIGGSVSLRSRRGDIDLIGTRFAGGQHVSLEAAGALTLRDALNDTDDDTQQYGASLYGNATASCNALQASCGTGLNVSLAGNASNSQSRLRQLTHSSVQAGAVILASGRDLNLIGARVQADGSIDVQAGGDLRVITTQDRQHSRTLGGDVNASLGVAANTRTLGTVTGSLGATVRTEHDNFATSSQVAGLQAGTRLRVDVQGDAHLQGAALTAKGHGSRVDIQGSTNVSEVRDWRDHDGGYFGGSVGISASTSMPTGSLSGGRIAGERQRTALLATIDVGQSTGKGELHTRKGVRGQLNQDAGHARRIDEDRRWAQNDISFTVQKLQRPGTKKSAASRADADPAPARYSQRLVVLADSDPQAGQSARRLAAKHPETTTLLQRNSDGTLQLLQAATVRQPGPAKLQVVGHGGTGPDGQPTLGGQDAATLARLLRPLITPETAKLAVVSCGSGACPGRDLSSRLSQELGPQAPPLKGYAGRIDVDADGRKHPVETAGLGPKRKRSASPDDAPQAKSAPPAAEPLGTLPPALARYLAEPANRQRHDAIAAPEDGLEHRRIDTHLASGSHEIVDRRYGDDPPNRFVNAFRPDEWILQANFRPNRQAPYYTSDVILAQYRQVSQRDGFAGVIPKRLVATEVINLPTHERLRRTPEGAELTRTLADTPLGKAARHIVEQGLGATLGPTRWDASTLSLTLNLQPQQPGAAATAPDRYGHRMIVPLDNDALTHQAAERLFAKHPDNSLLLQADDQGRWQITRGEAPAAGANAKIQFVGHGTRQGDTPLLGGMDAPYLAAMTQGLRPLLGDDGQIDKVALVGCGTASCPGQDLLSRLQPALQASGLHPALSGHPGRVDVDAQGRKHPVDSGGLTGENAGGPSTAAQQWPRLMYESSAAQISVSPLGRQLVIYAHGSADPTLDTRPGMSTHVQVPAGSRMDFYALEGQASVAVARFLVADYPDVAEAGLPFFTPYHRQAYRKLARQEGQTVSELLQELGEGGRRKETLPAGSLVKNYLLSPTFSRGGDVLRFNREAPHNGVDLIAPVARAQPVHLNELLDLVAATGHHYPIIHCVACRSSSPALEPPTDPAELLRLQELRQRPLPNPGWMRGPAADPTQDHYSARLILQQGTDIQSRLAADSLFGKHPRNSVLALHDAKDELQLLRVGDATEPTRIKLQVVGSTASLRGEPLLGGNNSVELSEWMQTVMRRLNWPLQSLAKVTMIDCTPGNCGGTALLDQLRARMADWHPPADKLLRGYDHSILVGPDGGKAPFPPLTRRGPVPGPAPGPAPAPAP